MDVLIPPDIPIAEIEWRILDNPARSTGVLYWRYPPEVYAE
jgi:hypothetical protein